MSELWAEFALLFLFIVGNGFFAAAEIAMVSAHEAPIAALAHRGDRRARRVARFKAQPDTFLATVQVGISLMTILAGITGGAVFVRMLQQSLEQLQIPWLQRAAAGLAFTTVTLAITYLSMVLGELVPKSVVLRHPERWALRLSGPVDLLARLAHPAVKFLASSGRLAARLLGAGRVERVTFITEEEVRWLVREGHKRGVFDDTERRLIAQVFSFAETQVRRAMTARTDVSAIDRNWERDRVLQFIATEGYSRYPVYEETLDRVVGIIHTRDVITVLTSGGVIILEDLIRPPTFVPESQLLGPLLRSMQYRQEHMAIVLDEFGGTAGLITMEDLLEEIVGEIRDEHDREMPEYRFDHRSGRARISGRLPIDEFNEQFKAELDDREEDTVAGYVVREMGRIPNAGDEIESGGIRFRVLEIDEHRIDLLEAWRPHPEPDSARDDMPPESPAPRTE